mgnify:CR=1 FL=1
MPIETKPVGTELQGVGPSRSMLVPAAYSESALPALRLARSSRIVRRVALVIL